MPLSLDVPMLPGESKAVWWQRKCALEAAENRKRMAASQIREKVAARRKRQYDRQEKRRRKAGIKRKPPIYNTCWSARLEYFYLTSSIYEILEIPSDQVAKLVPKEFRELGGGSTIVKAFSRYNLIAKEMAESKNKRPANYTTYLPERLDKPGRRYRAAEGTKWYKVSKIPASHFETHILTCDQQQRIAQHRLVAATLGSVQHFEAIERLEDTLWAYEQQRNDSITRAGEDQELRARLGYATWSHDEAYYQERIEKVQGQLAAEWTTLETTKLSGNLSHKKRYLSWLEFYISERELDDPLKTIAERWHTRALANVSQHYQGVIRLANEFQTKPSGKKIGR